MLPECCTMRLISGAVLVFCCVLLSACASRQEIAAKHAAAQQAADAERANRCGSFGYKVGTPDYSHCLERMYVQDQQQAVAEEAHRAAKREAASQALERAGAALQNISPPPPSVVHCNTMPNGIGTSTTCF
jgi:hypothetical protein